MLTQFSASTRLHVRCDKMGLLFTMQVVSSKRPLPTTALSVIITAYLIFLVLGFPDGMLGVAWPSMMRDFGVQNAQMGTMLLISTIGFLLTSFNTGRLIRWFGISTLLVVSSVVRAVGLLGIALAPAWPVLVGAAFIFGVGSGAIDGGMNTFFAMRVRSPRLMSWLHASFGLGATIAPIMLTALFSLGIVWRWGYVIVAILQVAMGLVVFVRAGEWQMRAEEVEVETSTGQRSAFATLALPIVWVNIAIFFFYAGIEVTAGNWSYSIFTESRGVSPEVAGLITGLYWGSFTAGRVFFGIIADRFDVVATIRTMAVTAVLAATLFWWNPINGGLGGSYSGLAGACRRHDSGEHGGGGGEGGGAGVGMTGHAVLLRCNADPTMPSACRWRRAGGMADEGGERVPDGGRSGGRPPGGGKRERERRGKKDGRRGKKGRMADGRRIWRSAQLIRVR